MTSITTMCNRLHQAIVPEEYAVQEHLDVGLKTYTREIFVPAGHLIIGKKHAKSCINILAQGAMVLKETLEDVGKLIEVTDKTVTFITKPGVQKIAYVVKDSIFINIFSNVTSTDITKIEDELIIPDIEFNKYLKEKELKCLS